MDLSKIKSWIKGNLNFVFIVGIPLVFSPLPAAIREQPAYCAYILIIMSLYWITECLPIAVTSLLPVLLFPLFGVLSSKCTSPIYFQDIQMLFFGGLVLAIGIEKTGLHERIALKIIMFFGSDPKWLLLGVMSVTGFLSLWISNTASTSMMLPIVVALVKQLAKYNPAFSKPKVNKGVNFNNKIQDITMVETIKASTSDKNEFKVQHVDYNDDEGAFHEEIELGQNSNDLVDTPAAKKLMKGFCLGIAYAASIGGAGSLVGTTPNLLLKGYFDDKYPKGGLNFLTYMAFCLPVSIIMVFVAWIIMSFIWLPKSELNFFKKKPKAIGQDPLQTLIRERYTKLGRITFEQKSIGFLFLLCVLLWLTRELFVIDGWAYFFGSKKFVSDTTPAILTVLLAFMWPKNNIFKGHKYEHLIKWSDMINFPWDVILLGGGSLAIAEGFEKSKLSLWVGDLLGNVIPKQKELALIIIVLFCEFGTEFTSNTSMASIFIPIADSLARKNDVLPHYFLLPLTICVSLAFLFPVATPPNAIVFGSGYIEIKDMIKSGIAIKLIGVPFLLLAASTWLGPIFSTAVVDKASANETIRLMFRAAGGDSC